MKGAGRREGAGLAALRRIDIATTRLIDAGVHADAPAAPFPATAVRRDREYQLGTWTAVYCVPVPMCGGESCE